MARMSDNDKSPSRDFGESSQWTDCILDSGATFHMTPQGVDFIPVSLENRDKKLKLWTNITSQLRKKDKFN